MPLLVHSVSGAPRPWRVLLALTFKKLDFDIKYMRADRGEHKAEPYLTLNPRGTVPTIEADGIVLRDSIAALAWLDRAYSDYPLFGKSPREAAIVWQITLESCDYLRSAGDLLLRPIFFQGARSATSDLRDAAVLFQKELARLETLLNLNPFLAGASPSAADAV